MTITVDSCVWGRPYVEGDQTSRWQSQAYLGVERPGRLIILEEVLRPINSQAPDDWQLQTSGVLLPGDTSILVVTRKKPVIVIGNPVTQHVAIMSIPTVIRRCDESKGCLDSSLRRVLIGTRTDQVQVFVGGMKFDECEIISSIMSALTQYDITNIYDRRRKPVVERNDYCWVMIR